MTINILLLIWGLTELIIGGIVVAKKDLLILKSIVESFSFINREFKLEKITDIKGFSRWIGEIVLVEGAIYIFLASAAIYFNMNFLIVIIFICIIEVTFFNIIIKGIQIISKE
ncbi:hypothetical protein R0131_02115 [Clostridium sp. AL.422]|uniref:hypothetical protein n=1 Tax=Clostridium TaxID=1485 RepID=UPI00293DC57E|nr:MULTISPECIES: hypothetical protein [unclassified Clostridium]MDV4149620.1 hypothetical protein [Clostridium sp. AL.422]